MNKLDKNRMASKSPTRAGYGGGGGTPVNDFYGESPNTTSSKMSRPGMGSKPSPGMGAKPSPGMGAKPSPGMGTRSKLSNPADNMPIKSSGGGGGYGGAGGYSQYGGEPEYDDGGGVAGTVPCRKCGRSFGEDRIAKHERACKVNAKPKKVKMFHKPISDKEKAKMDAVKEKTSKWRQQHQDFVQAMKYNRKMKAHEERGGDIRNLPPPPASSQAGLVPCPHCGRKFGEVQAARHIPACKNTVNKPKPPPARPTGPSYGGGGGAYGSKPSPSYGSSTYSKPSGGAAGRSGMGNGYGNTGGMGGGNSYGGMGGGMSSGMGGGMGQRASNTGMNKPAKAPSGGMSGGMGGGNQGSNYRRKF